MSEHLAELLDLELAWRRVKLDYDSNRTFVTHPFLTDLVELDRESWLRRLRHELASDAYQPSPPVSFPQPKGKWLVRPATMLWVDDEIVYAALVGAALPHIETALRWAQGDPDVSYQLSPDPGRPAWVRSDFRVWNEWRTRSLEKLGAAVQFVAVADIAAFYENIDFARLLSYLREVGTDAEVLELLAKCLHTWSQPRDKGIPQGYSASDILAKLYLLPVDQALKNEGYTHLRYVDDIRIFCGNLTAAKRSVPTPASTVGIWRRPCGPTSARCSKIRADCGHIR